MASCLPLCLLIQQANSRTIALFLLVAFFLVVIAAVPFEHKFYSSLRKQRILPSLAAEAVLFAVIVLLILGAMLDWFLSVRGIWLLGVLLALLIIALIYFLYWRMRLITSLYARARNSAQADMDKLLAELRKAAEEKQRDGKGEGGGGKDA